MKWKDALDVFRTHIASRLIVVGGIISANFPHWKNTAKHVFTQTVFVVKQTIARIPRIPIRTVPFGTIISVLLVLTTLYALYPSGDGAGEQQESVVKAFLYAVGIIIALGLLILVLVFSRGDGVSGSTPPTRTYTERVFGKWYIYPLWAVFGYAVLDMYRKFVFSQVPFEWKAWIPGFSWNTVEIIIAVVGVYFLLKKGKKNITTGTGTAGSGTSQVIATSKGSKEALILIRIVIAVGLGAIIYTLYEYHVAHLQQIATSIKSGYLYVPIHGLLFIGAISAAVLALVRSDKDWLEIPAWAAFYGSLFVGMWQDWFDPYVSDPLVPFWYVPFGVLGVLFFLQLSIKNDDTRTAVSIIFLFAMAAFWIPQITAMVTPSVVYWFSH